MQDPAHVRVQYSDSSNLDARAAIHARFGTATQPWFSWVADRLLAGPHERVLDVGGGPGGIWASERHRLPGSTHIVSSDLSCGMAAEAKRRIEGDERFVFIASDAQAIPFPDASFDTVVANHMLYHVPDLNRGLAEVVRVLQPGGRLLAATNGERHMLQLRELISKDELIVVRGFSLENGRDLLAAHFADVTCDRYEEALDVTEAEPILAYIRSMADFWIGVSPEDDLRTQIDSVIERDGVFRIEKDVGLFVAVRR
jgi:SAM-dependent methyltransferase